jgi:hypothetical protein
MAVIYDPNDPLDQLYDSKCFNVIYSPELRNPPHS